MSIDFGSLLDINRIAFSNAPTKAQVIDELVNISRENGKITDIKGFKTALFKRESLMSTGIGYGIAIPHVKLPDIEEFFITIGIHKRGVDWVSLDNKPIHLIFLIAGPESQQEKYLRILARITFVIKNPEKRKEIILCHTKYDVYKILMEI